MTSLRLFLISSTIFGAAIAASAAESPATTQSTPASGAQNVQYVAQAGSQTLATGRVSSEFSIFAPRAQTRSTRIDYSIWDEALNRVVLDLGPSLRQRASRPAPNIGTRRVTGHKSPYRLEGSRFTFAYLSDEYKTGLTEYRKDLEQVGSTVDIQALSRDEQLAYWLNLHNVAIIEKIAQAYPTQRPENIKIDVDGRKVQLDDAKFITVRGVKMSPKDIRTQIVYPNWSDADVIYGFYRGDIGSPILPRYAYDAQNVGYTISDNGYEFVNALRGFHESYDKRKVSAIYDEARPFFFPNWDQDLTAHLLRHAREDVADEVRSGKPYYIDTYDNMVADLSGGRRLGSSGTPIGGQISMSADTSRLLREVREKQQTLRARGVIGQQPKGWVVIEDLYDDEPTDPNAPTINELEQQEQEKAQ